MFNPPLSDSSKDINCNWQRILEWIGLFTSAEIKPLLPHFLAAITCRNNNSPNYSSFDYVKPIGRNIRIKPILFVLEGKQPALGSFKYVHGEEVLQYCWQCLCPTAKRTNCSTIYSYDIWGNDLAPIVKYFKYRNKHHLGVGTLIRLVFLHAQFNY